MNSISIKNVHTPLGFLLIGSYKDEICLCDWAKAKNLKIVTSRLEKTLKADFDLKTTKVLEEAERQLQAYLLKERQMFELPLLLVGTDFQKQVWQALLEIPYGETTTYAEHASRVGKPQSVRDVANAIGANALNIIVPCHRVIGADRALTGYAGGLDAKRFLLNLEQGLSVPSV